MYFSTFKEIDNMSDINILILSAGTRNKVVSYFKKELTGKGNVIATDCNPLAPAIYVADRHYIVPRIDEPGYLDVIYEICRKEQITAVCSLIDPELTLLSQHKQDFAAIGVTVIVSDADTVEICFDKFKMSQFLEANGFHTIKTYDTLASFQTDYEKNLVGFPVFVKPICGSCSMNIQKLDDMETLINVMHQYDDLMIQEFMDEKEYGIDVYVDMISHEMVSIFIKEKLLMRAGETDKSVSIKNDELNALMKEFSDVLPFFGHIDVDVFEKGGRYYISEVNPRFGGGYPHAYECGVNFPKLIIQNLEGHQNEVSIGNYDEDIYMMKYLDVFMKRGKEE